MRLDYIRTNFPNNYFRTDRDIYPGRDIPGEDDDYMLMIVSGADYFDYDLVDASNYDNDFEGIENLYGSDGLLEVILCSKKQKQQELKRTYRQMDDILDAYVDWLNDIYRGLEEEK